MAIDAGKEVAGLKRLTAGRLRDRYAEVFGEATTTGNKTWLVRRIAWRLQVIAEGDLTDRAKARAGESARDADLRVTPLREKPPAPVAAHSPVATGAIPKTASDDRLPPPGSVLTRKYKGTVVQVKVLRDGFEHAGAVYASLSGGQGRHGQPLQRVPVLPTHRKRKRTMKATTATGPRASVKLVRCGIYTRKSTEEGLDQEYNSLDAQRDAGEVYVRSQAGGGWVVVGDRYDDGGFTGANTDRPALKRLMADIAAGRIDCVVVSELPQV